MAEEFQESDIMFHDDEDVSDYEDMDSDYQSRTNKWKSKKQKTDNFVNTVPVNIPEYVNNRDAWSRLDDSDSEDDELVPPHLIVRQRVVGKMMAFSVCTGNEETLKGRDLSEARNLVLRLTGFLET